MCVTNKQPHQKNAAHVSKNNQARRGTKKQKKKRRETKSFIVCWIVRFVDASLLQAFVSVFFFFPDFGLHAKWFCSLANVCCGFTKLIFVINSQIYSRNWWAAKRKTNYELAQIPEHHTHKIRRSEQRMKQKALIKRKKRELRVCLPYSKSIFFAFSIEKIHFIVIISPKKMRSLHSIITNRPNGDRTTSHRTMMKRREKKITSWL